MLEDSYLALILNSFVRPSPDGFYLAHDDLHDGNILVDESGNITGIIDWEFHSVVPSYAGNHYPLLFTGPQAHFKKEYKVVFDDPMAELEAWRNFYAAQFKGDVQMEQYFENIDAMTALEKLLRDELSVLDAFRDDDLVVSADHLVKVCRFLQSPDMVDQLSLPFPAREPTKAPLRILVGGSASNTDPVNAGTDTATASDTAAPITDEEVQGQDISQESDLRVSTRVKTGTSCTKSDIAIETIPTEPQPRVEPSHADDSPISPRSIELAEDAR
jgi:Phosphotransferase enzyme family